MHNSGFLGHHFTLALDIFNLLILLICTVEVPQSASDMFLPQNRVRLSLTPERPRDSHIRVHKKRVGLCSQATVTRFENLRHDALNQLRHGIELAHAQKDARQHAYGFPEAGKETRAVRDTGGSHGKGEAALRMACLLEDGSLETEELDLRENVKVVLLDSLRGFFNQFERAAVVALSNTEVDREDGKKKGNVVVRELDGLQLSEEVFGCNSVVARCCESVVMQSSAGNLPVYLLLQLEDTREECPILICFERSKLVWGDLVHSG